MHGGLPLLAILAGLVLAYELATPPAVSAQEPTTSAMLAQVGGSPPSRFARQTSRRWAHGARYEREILAPVANPDPAPEPQPVRVRPFDVAVAGDGTKVYVGLQGSEGLPGSELAVYDVRQDRLLARIPLALPGTAPPASSPYRLVMHPAGRYLLVTSRFANFASVVDTRIDRVVAEVPLDFYCQGVAFQPDGRTAYVANRYLDQVFVVDVAAGEGFQAAMREIGGLDEQAFTAAVQPVLQARCGAIGCHDEMRGGLIAGRDAVASFRSVIPHVRPGDAAGSRLLTSVTSTRHGGTADAMPRYRSHANGEVVFADPANDADHGAIARWIDAARDGPGWPVGNPRSKPKVCVLDSSGRHLIVGNTGTQDLSILDAETGVELGGIFVQNVVNDVVVFHAPRTGHDWLIVSTEGLGFGVARERDPFGAESWDADNPAAHWTLWRDLATGRTLGRAEQQVLGPFDAVDGTAAIKFRDIQNDILLVDLTALGIPAVPPPDGPRYLLHANRYEAHRAWVRYTSDTAESTFGDVKGDIPPELMRVVGALPERMVLLGDRVFVTMQASNLVQEWRVDPDAADAADMLVPLATHPTGYQPIGIAAGPAGTPAADLVFTANFMAGSISVIDCRRGTSREVVVDPSVEQLPFPATNAERGEFLAHSALFSSDGDTSCFHCHYLDMGDGRPWGVSQVASQEYLSAHDAAGQLVIGGTMGIPQMRGLQAIQPFFFEGVLSVFEPRSMLMEHCPADDFKRPTPQGDFTGIRAHYRLEGTSDVQSGMDTTQNFDADVEERRDEMFRRVSMQHLGKAYTLRDFQRFVGEWQVNQPRLLPVPFDKASASVKRGELLFADPRVGCISCHAPPAFAKKDFADNQQQALPPQVTTTVRDGAFTLIGMNRLDAINGYRRDLEPWDAGRVEERQAHYTTFPLRGIWDRPPVFLHHGMARSLREVVAVPGHAALRRYRYEVLFGGVPERPGRREVGFNTTYFVAGPTPATKLHVQVGGRIGIDTHGGTSQLTAQQVDDLVAYLETIE